MNNFNKIFDNTIKNNSKFSATNPATDFEKLSDKDLYKYCKIVGFNARKWHRRFIAVLPEVAKRRLYKKYGYCSLHEFAAKMAGVSRENVDDVLRVDEKLKEMPKIKSLIGESGLNKVRLIANIAKPETENFWAEKIQNMTFSSLRILINEKFRFKTEDEKTVKILQGEGQKDLLDSETFRSQIDDASTGEGKNSDNNEMEAEANIRNRNKKPFTIHIDDETEFELRKFKQQLEKEKKEPVDWNFTLKEMIKSASKVQLKKLHPSVKSATASESRTEHEKIIPKLKDDFVPKQEPVSFYFPLKIKHSPGLKQSKITRYIPAKIKHKIEQKHNGRCAYSGCNKPAEQIHHPVRFAARPNHENLVPLCREHHDFVHQTSSIDRIINRFKSEKFAAGGG